jgi:hypothetical protein
MTAVRCKACGAEPAKGALVCPACGAKLPKTVSPLPLMVAGLIVAALLMFWFGR